MSLQSKQEAFTMNVSKLIAHIFSSGYSCTFGDAYRSPEQAALNAKCGKGIQDSMHCKRLAIDLNLFDKSGNYVTDKQSYEPFGKFWERLDSANRWGGNFHHKDGTPFADSNHFESNEF